MVIIGIDPGLAHTGWGIIETRTSIRRARAYGCIATTPEETLPDRLQHIFQELSDICERYQPEYMGIESVFFGQNSRSAIATAHARGAALVAAGNHGLVIEEYTPMQIKQAVVGTGSADKYQVIFMVQRLLELDHTPRPDHAADALGAALCCANSVSTRELTKRRSKTL